MNTTQAYVYIRKKGPHSLIIVWERGDIEDMELEFDYIFIGTCQYDTETKTIIKWERR